MSRILRALFDFNVQYQDELSLNKGDLVKVIDNPESIGGWLFGEKDNCTGWFPESFTEAINCQDLDSSKLSEIKVVERLEDAERELYSALNILRGTYLLRISESLPSTAISEMVDVIDNYLSSIDKLGYHESPDESDFILHFCKNFSVAKRLFRKFSILHPQVLNFLRDSRSGITLLLQSDDITFSLSKILGYLDGPVKYLGKIISILSEFQYSSNSAKLTVEAKHWVKVMLDYSLKLWEDHAEERRSQELAQCLLLVPPFSKDPKITLNDIIKEYGDFKIASKMIIKSINEQKDDLPTSCCILILFSHSLFILDEHHSRDNYANAYLDVRGDWIVSSEKSGTFTIHNTRIGDVSFQVVSQRLSQKWFKMLNLVIGLDHPSEEEMLDREIKTLKSVIKTRAYNNKDATTFYDVSLFRNQYGVRSVGLGCKQIMDNVRNSIGFPPC